MEISKYILIMKYLIQNKLEINNVNTLKTQNMIEYILGPK